MIVRASGMVVTGGSNLLCHFNGVDGATTFPDSGGQNHTLTAAGNVQIDTAQSVFGGASCLFDGTGDYLTLDGSADFAFGTGDFTIDFRFRLNAIAGVLYDGRPSAASGFYPTIYIGGGVLIFYSNGANRITGTTTILTNTWYHVAVVRSGTSIKLYVNGTAEGGTYVDSNSYVNGASRPMICADGQSNGAASFIDGWVDELRILDTAAWTTNFTPSAAAYDNPTTSSASFTDSAMPVIGYDNIVTISNIDATSEDADFPVVNLANPATHLKWKEDAASPQVDQYITIAIPQDLTTSPISLGAFDYVGIAKHNFGTLGCTVSVETTSDVSSPITGFTEVATHTPTDDAPIIFQLDPATASYVRIKIALGTAGVREAAVVYAGTLLTFERSIKVDVMHTPINLGRRSDILSGTSESGNFIGRIVRNQYNESKAEFAHFTNDWYRASLDPFIVASKTLPFFWAWDPANFPTDVGYAWLTKDSVPELNPITGRFNLTLEMRGLA